MPEPGKDEEIVEAHSETERIAEQRPADFQEVLERSIAALAKKDTAYPHFDKARHHIIERVVNSEDFDHWTNDDKIHLLGRSFPLEWKRADFVALADEMEKHPYVLELKRRIQRNEDILRARDEGRVDVAAEAEWLVDKIVLGKSRVDERGPMNERKIYQAISRMAEGKNPEFTAGDTLDGYDYGLLKKWKPDKLKALLSILDSDPRILKFREQTLERERIQEREADIQAETQAALEEAGLDDESFKRRIAEVLKDNGLDPASIRQKQMDVAKLVRARHED